MERNVEKVIFSAPLRPHILRVAAYARVSGGKDAMLHSLSAQVSYYSEWNQSNPEWMYCGVYADEALTGTKDSRGEFQRMPADCRQRRLDMIHNNGRYCYRCTTYEKQDKAACPGKAIQKETLLAECAHSGTDGLSIFRSHML